MPWSCASNMNRSMEAHNLLKNNGFTVRMRQTNPIICFVLPLAAWHALFTCAPQPFDLSGTLVDSLNFCNSRAWDCANCQVPPLHSHLRCLITSCWIASPAPCAPGRIVWCRGARQAARVSRHASCAPLFPVARSRQSYEGMWP